MVCYGSGAGDHGYRMCSMGRAKHMLSMESSPSQCQSEEHMSLCCSTASVPKYLPFTPAYAEKPADFLLLRTKVQFQHFNSKGNICTIVWPASGNYTDKFTAFFLSFFPKKLLWVVGCMKPCLIISRAPHNRSYSAEIYKTVCGFGFCLINSVTWR